MISASITRIETEPPVDTAEVELSRPELEDLLAEALDDLADTRAEGRAKGLQLERALALIAYQRRELDALDVAIGQIVGIRAARAIRASMAMMGVAP